MITIRLKITSRVRQDVYAKERKQVKELFQQPFRKGTKIPIHTGVYGKERNQFFNMFQPPFRK